MKSSPLSILKAAGWILDVNGSAKPSRKRWPASGKVLVRKGESSAICSHEDSTVTFRICRRGECEDFTIPFSDVDSIRRLSSS